MVRKGRPRRPVGLLRDSDFGSLNAGPGCVLAPGIVRIPRRPLSFRHLAFDRVRVLVDGRTNA